MWEALLDAEMNECFWSGEAQRANTVDLALKWTSAILSSGTVASLLTNHPSLPWLTPAVAILTSVLSVSQVVYFNSTRLKSLSVLAAQWSNLARDYRLLWAKWEDAVGDDPPTVWEAFEVVVKRERQDESGFRINQKRLRFAQRQVKENRRLP